MPSRRSRQTLLALGLGVLVVLSGCAGLFGADSGTPATAGDATTAASSTVTPTDTATATPTPSPTATPADTPTTPPTATPTPPSAAALPPGVAATGVRNATAAVRAHQAGVVGTPGLVTHTTNTTARETTVRATVTVAATANLTRVRYVSRARTVTGNDTRPQRSAITANGSAVRQYTVVDGNVTLDNRRERTELFDRSLRGLATARGPLQGLLSRGNFTVVTDTDAEVVALRADRYAGTQLYDPANVVRYDATVRMGSDGVIREASERIVAQRDRGTSEYRFNYRFERRPVDLPAAPTVPESVRHGADANATARE